MANDLLNRQSLISDYMTGLPPNIGYQNQAISNYYNQNPLASGAPRQGAAQGFADIASTLGAFSQGEKADRSLKGDWTQNYDRLMLDAQAARAANEKDALHKLAITNYIGSGGSPYKPATLDLGGKATTLPSYGFGPRAISDAQRTGAGMLEGQMLDRLKPGGSYTPTDPSEYTSPGTMERLGSYGGSILGGLGALDTITGGRTTGAIGGLLGKIPGFGGGGAASTAASAGAGAAGAAGSSPIIAGALNGLTPAQNAAGIGSMAGSGLSGGGAGTAGAGLAGSLGAAGAGAGLALGYNMAENGLFRGGQEGVKVNPKRDSFSQKFVEKYGGTPYEAMAKGLAEKGIVGPQAQQMIQAIYSAQDMPSWQQAYTNFVKAGLGDVFVTTAEDSFRQAMENRARG